MLASQPRAGGAEGIGAGAAGAGAAGAGGAGAGGAGAGVAGAGGAGAVSAGAMAAAGQALRARRTCCQAAPSAAPWPTDTQSTAPLTPPRPLGEN